MSAGRVCAESAGRSYCGRRKETRAQRWDRVTCVDCRAMYRADGGRPPEIVGDGR